MALLSLRPLSQPVGSATAEMWWTGWSPTREAGAMTVLPFEDDQADGVARLARAEGWPTFSDPERVRRLFRAPGVVARVAVDSDAVLGAGHALSDGHHAYLTFLVVDPRTRRRGVGRKLVEEILRGTGAERLDLLSTPASDGFYRSLDSKEFSGFRLYPDLT
jgi:ribosomal protein S18 acetylase RimI-like enzyme